MIYNCALGYTLPQLEVSTLTFLVTSKTLVIGVNEFVFKKNVNCKQRYKSNTLCNNITLWY